MSYFWRHQTPSNPANKHHTATRTFQLLIFVGLPSSWMLWPRKLCILSPPPSTPGGGVAAVWRKGMVGARRAGENHLNFSRALNPGGLAKGLCWAFKRCQAYKAKRCDLLILYELCSAWPILMYASSVNVCIYI